MIASDMIVTVYASRTSAIYPVLIEGVSRTDDDDREITLTRWTASLSPQENLAKMTLM